MPELQAFYEKYRNQEVVLLTVNIMQGETIAGIQEFMKEGGYTMPVALDKEGTAGRLYGVRGIPTTYFIDKEGYLRYTYPGPLTLKVIEQYVQTL